MDRNEMVQGDAGADQEFLTLAAMFESEFSIDWIQELSKAKASTLLNAFEKFCKKRLMEKKGAGIFAFSNQKIKKQTLRSIPKPLKEKLHKDIARVIISEDPDTSDGIIVAGRHLLNINNNIEGCRLLLKAGNISRRKGLSEIAIEFYDKALEDLQENRSNDADMLFIEIVIGYSKDYSSIRKLEQKVHLLEEALQRSIKVKNYSYRAIILLYLGSIEYVRLDHKPAQKYFYEGRKLARDLDEPEVERTLLNCSIVHYCFSGRFKEAILSYESKEPMLAKKFPAYRRSFKLGIVIGVSYGYIGKISQGLGMLNQIRDDALAISDYDAAAHASFNIAVLLLLKNDLKNAEIQVNNIFKKIESFDLYTRCFGTLLLAYIFLQKKNFKKSYEHLKEAYNISDRYMSSFRGYLFEFCHAIETSGYPPIPGLALENEIRLSQEDDNPFGKGVAYRFQAMLQQKEGEASGRIVESLNKSLKYLQESGHKFEIGLTQQALARHFLEKGNKEKSKRYAESAAKIFHQYSIDYLSDDLKPIINELPYKNSLIDEIFSFAPEVVELSSIKAVAKRILSAAIKITNAERGAIFLVSSGSKKPGLKLWSSKNFAVEDLEAVEFKDSYKMIEESLKSDQIQFFSELHSKGKRFKKKNAIKSCTCVPLKKGGKIIGILYQDNLLFGSKFKTQDLQILSYFGSLAAIALDNALAYEEIRRLNERLNDQKLYLEEQQLDHIYYEDFVAASQPIREVLKLVEQVAATDSTVMILGETGAGKEMIARAIHEQSPRRENPFIRVNCSAFPESLIPSELFGHEKGAFTGATQRRIGRFELADTGTIFLDEIGDISMNVQIRLLRVLQTKKFERIGGNSSINSDFRLLVATNRNLEKAVEEGRFRLDLFYRLNVFPIVVPPLRERLDDIPPLALYFLQKYSKRMNKTFKGIAEKDVERLKFYHWPGNVRELQNVIERGAILSSGQHFQLPELANATSKEGGGQVGQLTLEEMERRYIKKTLQNVNWKIYGAGGAAELLGMHHSTLYSKMKKLGIKKNNKK